MAESFTPDDNIRKIAEAYSLDCVDFAQQHFRLKLDWSDASVRHIETMLERFHAEMSAAKPPQEEILRFAKLFGSYVGEVFRRNHGAKWGRVELGGDKSAGLRADKDGTTFWPWGRAQNRLVNGPEDNVWHYYQVLVSEHGNPASATEPAPNEPPSKKSVWQRIRGA
jgi:hypothetical protein